MESSAFPQASLLSIFTGYSKCENVYVCLVFFYLLGIHNVENCISPQNLKNGFLGIELYNIINLEKIVSNTMLKDEDHIY